MTTSDDKRFGDDNKRLEAKILKNPMDFSKKSDLIGGGPISSVEARRKLQGLAGRGLGEAELRKAPYAQGCLYVI